MNWNAFTHDEWKLINETIVGDREHQKTVVEALTLGLETSARLALDALRVLREEGLVIEPRLRIEG
jgi:hypothetical protein